MSESRLRIALVSREYPPFFGGGIGTYARWIVPALTQAGVRVHVITETHDRTQPRVEIDGLATIHRVPVFLGLGGWTNAAARFSINAGRIVAELWRTGQIDIAEFAECEAAASVQLMLRNTSRKIPTAVQLHTPSEQLFVLRSLSSTTMNSSLVSYFHNERIAMRLADAILAPSSFIARWAQTHYGLSTSPTVIPYATGPLPPAPLPAPVDQPPTVLYAGRIEPRKGVESLIRAWPGVVALHPTARLVLAGGDTSCAPDGGSMRAYLLELLCPSVRSSVQFVGRLNADALRTEVARASLCVIPSLWENFPNTCIESMSSARAVLVGDQGGMREMIGTTRAGLTFIAGDEHDLKEKLCAMLAEGASSLEQRGKEARTRIEAMCHPQTIAQRRIEHFHNVIAQAREHTNSDSVALRDAWLGLEHVARGTSGGINLPELSSVVKRWVECEETIAC